MNALPGAQQNKLPHVEEHAEVFKKQSCARIGKNQQNYKITTHKRY